ncbi:helix-turn-helix transcriptional regulator [Psychromonas sp. KJ10-10]|uniref:helix-turn-helix transcriptional regulator n=1 Tax=Psychromonas sp. KJ10-10 TaxID=3391823 RepID=UPI0039B48912
MQDHEKQNTFKIYRQPTVSNLFGIGKSSTYERIKKGILPPPISLGGRSVGWVASEVESVLKAMIRGESEAQLKALVIELTNQRQELH